MSEEFDPYYKWLAIPPKDQPPHHYRLLAVEPFEADRDVLANAADQRMAHVKAFQSGEHSVLSQQLLNEIAAARNCLLNEETKADYDEALRRELGVEDDSSDAHDAASVFAAFDGSGPSASSKGMSTAAAGADASGVMIKTAEGDAGDGKVPSRPGAPAKDTSREFKIRVIGHIIAPIVGLLLGTIILWFIKPEIFGGGDHGEEISYEDPEYVDPGDPPPRKFKIKQRKRKKPDIQIPPVPPVITTTDGGTDSDIPDPGELTDGGSTGAPPPPPPPPPPVLTPEERLKKLEEEKDQALADGNLAKALEAAEKIAALREEDILEAQTAVLEEFHTKASAPEQFRSFAESGIKVIDQAIADKRKDVGDRLKVKVLGAARASGDQALATEATKRIIQLNTLGG